MLHVTGNQKEVGVACPSGAEWTRKMWHFYTMDSYPAIRKDGLRALVGKWMQREIMLMGEMAQSHMGEPRVVSLVQKPKGVSGIQNTQ